MSENQFNVNLSVFEKLSMAEIFDDLLWPDNVNYGTFGARSLNYQWIVKLDETYI